VRTIVPGFGTSRFKGLPPRPWPHQSARRLRSGWGGDRAHGGFARPRILLLRRIGFDVAYTQGTSSGNFTFQPEKNGRWPQAAINSAFTGAPSEPEIGQIPKASSDGLTLSNADGDIPVNAGDTFIVGTTAAQQFAADGTFRFSVNEGVNLKAAFTRWSVNGTGVVTNQTLVPTLATGTTNVVALTPYSQDGTAGAARQFTVVVTPAPVAPTVSPLAAVRAACTSPNNEPVSAVSHKYYAWSVSENGDWSPAASVVELTVVLSPAALVAPVSTTPTGVSRYFIEEIMGRTQSPGFFRVRIAP